MLFGLSTLCAVSPTFGLENNSTQIKNSIVTQKEQNTDSTSATTLKKRKFSFNKPDARALIESLGALGLIITVPCLTYAKLVTEPKLKSENANAEKRNSEQFEELKNQGNYILMQKEDEKRLKRKLTSLHDENSLLQVDLFLQRLNPQGRHVLYTDLIERLENLCPTYEGLEKIKFIYRCELFVYGLSTLPWLREPAQVSSLITQIAEGMQIQNGEYVTIPKLLAGTEIYEKYVQNALYPSMEGMMYLIFGDELPEGIETAKKIWQTIDESEYQAAVPFLYYTLRYDWQTVSITRQPRWEIYEVLLNCNDMRGRLDGESYKQPNLTEDIKWFLYFDNSSQTNTEGNKESD